MNKDLANRVLAFVSDQVGVRRKRVTIDTTLAHGLGLDGDDAAEFMEAFAREFRIDMEQFDSGRHFGPEAACFPPLMVYYWIRRLFGRTDVPSDLQPISIRHLVAAAEAGRWNPLVSEASK